MNKVSYLGIAGSNSYVAAIRYFGEQTVLIGTPRFLDIFNSVINKNVDFGIIPIENSLAGSIVENYDLLLKLPVTVVGEYYLKFENHLLGITSNIQEFDIRQIKKVYSHPQPLAQCFNFFNSHKWIEKISYSDTAAASKFVSENNDPSCASIGNREASKLYNLEILRENIADNVEGNFTRFFVVAINPIYTEIPNKATFQFTLQHVPGSLSKLLTIFANYSLNLNKIESRPIHGTPFEYIFIVDIELNEEFQNNKSSILNEIKENTTSLQILGYYKGGII
ncbi:MAG: prephenate dehydratase domain-containing protein [Candidatus Roizmanbacteria bacterium]